MLRRRHRNRSARPEERVETPGDVHVVTAVNVGGRGKVNIASSRVDHDASPDESQRQSSKAKEETE
jgi:hypothetical protein